MKLIVSLIILIFNIICACSIDVSTYATINSYKQNSVKKGDDVQITCDLSKVKETVINVTFIGPAGLKFCIWVREPADKKPNFQDMKTVPGSTNTTEGTVGSEGVSAIIKNVTDNKIQSPYACEVYYKTDKDPNHEMSKNSVELKFWNGSISETGIFIYSDDKTKAQIAEFKDGNDFKIECSPGKIANGKFQNISLLQGAEPVVNFMVGGEIKNQTLSTKDGIKNTDYNITKAYTINVKKARDKIQGTYTCEYIASYDTNSIYKTENHAKIEHKNFGLKIHLSASLIIMSFVILFLTMFK